jgi:hypothetical protein
MRYAGSGIACQARRAALEFGSRADYVPASTIEKQAPVDQCPVR